MKRLTQEAQIGPFASLRDKAEAKPRAFNDYDCFLAHARAVTALKAYEDICFDEDGKERITIEELSTLVKARDEGRVVVLPCKVGDTLYTESPIRGMVTPFKAPDLAWIIENISEFGKTVFLTRAEAEAVLNGGHDGIS